ncbi:DUF3662 and FHA domain-containing protein [Mycobacterium sp. MYCO198283]|uniref:DUF3662 and FHA domain-containing protein n=1 Tax=Mycobacterium sp. MYCO198283 TaxID=2883505 RepID=UPI001E494C6B|nr:DUF3662 and FHA domain-containing protein [Mycobacterium sp. MYCO198283]MCG5433064.1 DUF3662 and FHA domain-containing protein [Mycobacterium sp. MYCO198283]
MSFVKRIERKLEASVGDAAARMFGGTIVPQEVESALQREADDGVRTVGGGRRLAPNEYVITLGPTDHRKVTADPDITPDTFAKHLNGYIREQGWQTYGDVVVRFEQSAGLHTGQFRARGVVNPDATPPRPTPRHPDHAHNAEPGVVRMTDNPSYRAGQGQGRPADDYYDDRYGRPQDDPRGAGPDPRAPYPDQGGYPPPPAEPNYPPRGGYDRGGYPDQGGYAPAPPPYEPRPPAGYGQPPGGGYDQGYPQQGPGGGYGQPAGPPGGYGDYDYGRAPAAPGRHEEPAGGGYPDQGGYGRPGGGYGDYEQPSYQPQSYGRQDYAQPDYGRYDQPGGGYEQGGGYDYGQGGYGGYDQPAGGGYGAASSVTLQLDDGSGRTYQLREGANIIGRGQDAQFRLPDTGVSRRHLEIRWDGQVALLTDLNSTNGTTVNNAPVQEWQLADGDVIRLGHSEIIVRVH